MAGILDGVDQRTQLAGQNRMELLLFRLGGRQRYGINVFKVREVIECPPLRVVPNTHPAMVGMTTLRGKTIPVVDLPRVMGLRSLGDGKGCYLIVTEFNRSVQGLMVQGVDRIVNLRWEQVMAPPSVGNKGYLTAVTKIDEELIEILDVEKVLMEVSPLRMTQTASETIIASVVEQKPDKTLPVLVVDDSSTARKMIARTLEQAGVEYFLANNGREALDQLKAWVAEGTPISERISLVVSDIEMPEMDGYTLTAEIRKHDALRGLYVMLHSSMSGVFNDTMAKKVGADRFLAKFSADELTKMVLEVVYRHGAEQAVNA